MKVIQSMCSENNRSVCRESEIQNRILSELLTAISLNNLWIKEQIIRQIIKYSELRKNKNVTYQNGRMLQKLFKRNL